MSSPGEYERPVDGDHALLVGVLAGAVLQEGFAYQVEILDDSEGNHLATFVITAPSGRYLVHVVKVVEEEASTEATDEERWQQRYYAGGHD